MHDPIANLLGSWSSDLNIWSILFRLILSIVFSAVVGMERSSNRHAAGLRTFILLSTGATLAMIIDLVLIEEFGSTFALISTATIIGIAIISANTLLYSAKNQIKGLTTSVSMWTIGVIGLLFGTGYYTVAIIVGVVFVIVLSMLPAFERYLKNRSNHFEFHLELVKASNLKDFITIIRKLGLRIDGIENNPAYVNSGLAVYSVSVSITKDELKQYKTHKDIIEALNTLEYVYHIEEMV